MPLEKQKQSQMGKSTIQTYFFIFANTKISKTENAQL